MFKLDNIEKLNSECFIYENYESNWWSLFNIDYKTSLDNKNVMDVIKKYAVGYCESSRVNLRPKDNSYAVMFEREGKKFWFHVQKGI
jgi:hypothetical protein